MSVYNVCTYIMYTKSREIFEGLNFRCFRGVVVLHDNCGRENCLLIRIVIAEQSTHEIYSVFLEALPRKLSASKISRYTVHTSSVFVHSTKKTMQ